MSNKQQIREKLINNPLYKAAVHSSTEEDRKKIESSLEPLFVDLISTMEMFIERVKENPEAKAEFIRGLTGNRQVINSEQQISGSIAE